MTRRLPYSIVTTFFPYDYRLISGSANMRTRPGFRSGLSVGVGAFLVVDMILIHMLLRLHGVLLSEAFEFSLLIIGILILINGLRTGWRFPRRRLMPGIVSGIGVTLFADVFFVDLVLQLHSIRYPLWIHLLTGLMAFLAMVHAALYEIRSAQSVDSETGPDSRM